MIDFRATLAHFEVSGGKSSELAREFLGANPDVSRYVLGRNQHALSCIELARIDGLVDDFYPENSTWNGHPVIRAHSMPRGAIVVNCSMSIRPVSAHRRLAGIDGVRVLSYADLVRADPGFPLPDFVASFRSDYVQNEGKWRFVESFLADKLSLSVLNSLMLYRLTGDYSHMTGFSVRFNEQYFDPVVRLSDEEVFVDCGGFDGDTILEFCSRNPKYKQIYMFEPSPPNFDRARKRLEGFENLSLIPVGVSDVKGVLAFDPGAGSASSVSMAGSMTIDVVSIDEYISRPVSFIKMDLEGWELQALTGARRHILEDHPKLAISVYHHASDFWRIPEYVLGLRDDYNVYLRHYSEGWSETVMYFIPREAT
jgi:FkbM family methyltransferase